MARPKVSVLSLGGTIASLNAGGPGVRPSLTGEALVETVPELSNIAEVSATSLHQVAGSEVSLEDVNAASRQAIQAIDDRSAGIVVTQGTDTIEETAFVPDLLVDRDAPVVVTGAMRNPTLPGADGPANLLAAVRVAGSAAARGIGAVVVLNDEIHAARYVKKTHTQNTATFKSPLTGRLDIRGRAAHRGPHGDPPTRRVARAERGSGSCTAKDRTRRRRTAARSHSGAWGYAGLVIEALGGGHVPSVMVEPLTELAAGMPVVLASRTGSGDVLRRTHDFPAPR